MSPRARVGAANDSRVVRGNLGSAWWGVLRTGLVRAVKGREPLSYRRGQRCQASLGPASGCHLTVGAVFCAVFSLGMRVIGFRRGFDVDNYVGKLWKLYPQVHLDS